MKTNDPIATLGNYRLSYRSSDEMPEEKGNTYIISFIGLIAWLATTFSLLKVLMGLGAPLFLTIILVILMILSLSAPGFLSTYKITSIKGTKMPKPNLYYQYTLAFVLSGFGLLARYLSYKDASPTLIFKLSCVVLVLAVMYYAHVVYTLLYASEPNTALT